MNFCPSFLCCDNTVSLELNEKMTIYADPEKIARVFGNILKNASAYSYPNTTILVSAVQSEQYIAISFQNKGKTIPSEKLAALFDKFSRLDEARISDTGGTGLGLAIAKEIVLLHGGTIEAHSETRPLLLQYNCQYLRLSLRIRKFHGKIQKCPFTVQSLL